MPCESTRIPIKAATFCFFDTLPLAGNMFLAAALYARLVVVVFAAVPVGQPNVFAGPQAPSVTANREAPNFCLDWLIWVHNDF